jgi:hypothetical protein
MLYYFYQILENFLEICDVGSSNPVYLGRGLVALLSKKEKQK